MPTQRGRPTRRGRATPSLTGRRERLSQTVNQRTYINNSETREAYNVTRRNRRRNYPEELLEVNQRLIALRAREHVQQENQSEHDRRQRFDILRARRNHSSLKLAMNPSIIPDYYSLGHLSSVCDKCQAKHFASEKVGDHFNMCCHNGKVNLPQLRVPEILKGVIQRDLNNWRSNYLNNIRQLNSSFGFASFEAQIAEPLGRGPYCFRIHGSIHHRVGTLHPNEGASPNYAQLYILDTAEATEFRTTRNANCNKHLMAQIHELLSQINPLAQQFKMMAELECEEQIRAQRENRVPYEVRMVLYRDNDSDQRRYNLPTARNSEIAAIFTTKDGDPPPERNLKIYPRNESEANQLQFISTLNRQSDPMVYPLLFPYGEFGYDSSLLHEEVHRTAHRNKITQLQFISYRLAIRDEFSLIHSSDKLTQQFIVDQYVRIEGGRLNFIRQNQKQLRVESYAGLHDYIMRQAEQENVLPGRIVVLPSSFQGSPRNMNAHYQDAMSLVRKYGKPSLFITFTCNPKWSEILENVEAYQKPNMRPDLTARVFHKKLKELLADIHKKQIFGHVKYMLHVIEFQKRGLPHAHILVALSADDNIREPSDIDLAVCAEIPDHRTEPELFEIVSKCMVHGPCGHLKPSSPCMSDGKCTKEYPKAFVEETKENVNGYPLYRRRNDGRKVVSKVQNNIIELDNTWIVPYNKHLTKKYNAHINVEICSSVQSVKYLHKYIYKGYDCANVVIIERPEDLTINYDEISTFLDARYVSAPEACWRIFEFPMQEKTHKVQALAVHLPNFQDVYFQENNVIQAAANAEFRDTTLTAFFNLNHSDSSAHQYFYHEIPEHYVWQDRQRKWNKRKNQSNTLGRIYTVDPKNRERFALRLLLVCTKGPISFDNLRTVNNTVLPSFWEAALARNILANDNEWIAVLTEAASFQMPGQLRRMFSMICAFCTPSNPLDLWNRFKVHMIEDFIRINSTEFSEQLALKEIGSLLHTHNATLADFNLPEHNFAIEQDQVFDVNREANLADRVIRQLNQEQREIFNEVVLSLDTNEAKMFYIDGPGGSGKTFLYNALIHFVRGQGLKVLAVAWTGIASILLPGGRTAHNVFKFPIPLTETAVSLIKSNSKAAQAIRNAKLIIWDEASMVPGNALICLDRLLRDLHQRGIPFGGKAKVMGCDFRQVLSVVTNAARATIIGNCLKRCSLWPLFKQFILTTNMRTLAHEVQFTQLLLRIGNGSEPSEDGKIKIPESMLLSQETLIDWVFEPQAGHIRLNHIKERAILCPKNDNCAEINEKIINILPGEEREYLSADSIVTTDEAERVRYPTEFLHSLTLPSMPPHKLRLKVGTVVMLIRNLNTSEGLVNGTRLIIIAMHPNCLDTEVITGDSVGKKVLLPRIDLQPSDTSFPFILKRRQFPVIIAFAITINKSQGQTFDKVGLDLSKACFAHGQLYVAMSRVRSMDSIKVQVKETAANNNRTENIVYPEVL